MNRRNQALRCSLFYRENEKTNKAPLMMFCHGNTGNRTSSYKIVYSMLRTKVNVITFDFSGCGLSDGQTNSLGYYENYDIGDVLDYALKNFKFIDETRIGLWGRSMGAVSALLFSSRTTCISLLVLDSPFPDFPSLLRHYIDKIKILPKWAEDYIYNNIRIKVKEQAFFDFEEVAPINKLNKCQAPALFIHGTDDGIVPMHLFKKIYEAYPCAKEYIELKSAHNDTRPDHVYETVGKFVKSKFFSKPIYGRFEPTPKQSTTGKNPVKSSGYTLLSLDSIRFNDHNLDNNGLNHLEQVIESLGSQEFSGISTKKKESHKKMSIFHEEVKSQLDRLIDFKGFPNTTTNSHSHKRSNSEIKMRKPEGKRLDTEMILEGEDEGDISEELLEPRELTNRDYLEVSYINTAAKVTFDNFRKIKKRFPSSISAPKGELPF